ncbi:MAG: DUF6510 family protein [Myxococcaceae bacterium]
MNDITRELMVDGNAVAGLLSEVFGCDMTTCPCQCAHCAAVGVVATLLAFTHAPGTVLRCPVCLEVVLRVVRTSEAVYLDARGASYVSLRRTVS